MRRLYLQLYAAILAVLLVFALMTSLVFWHLDENTGSDRWLDEITALAQSILPPPTAAPHETRRVLQGIATSFRLDLALFDPDGERLAAIGRPVAAIPFEGGSRWIRNRDHRMRIAIHLEDGRWLVAEGEHDHRPLPPIAAAIALLGLATAIVAYPLTRRLTRRLEALRTQVEAVGEGRLGERVEVEGRDEIADLATAFNRTADRIERLVSDKTRLLANTSHELRTPLTRIRMALELVRDAPRPELLDRVDRDIEELDDLIGELLVASRLDAPEAALEFVDTDLAALCAEEAARSSDVTFEGSDGRVAGDPRLLRRSLRNLIQNALRHGEPPVTIRLTRAGESVRIRVDDCGPGLPESERERIFEPFYRPAGQATAEGGIGLGLALVRQIADRHGGTIRCERIEGKGTRFILELPSTEPSAPD